jgi:RNA polymerase sigma-70 factor (ECF subfamily)
MEELTPRERVAFTMRHCEQCSSEEIGTVLGLRPNAARNAIFRAVQKLRRSLAPLVGAEV